MNILALLTDGFGASGGIAQYNRDLLTALSQSAPVERVTVLPRFGHGDAQMPERVTQAAARPHPLRWSAEAARLALSRRFDVIFCGHLNTAPLAAALARLSGARIWLQVHGIEAWTAPRSLANRAAAQSTLVTSVSRHTRRQLLGWCNIAPERVRVLPNTVSSAFSRQPRRADLVQRHKLAGKRVILTVGRLASTERYKGHDRLIRALPDIAADVPEAVYLIVGSGPDLPRLAALAQALGVAGRVVFAGQVPADELPDYFALADVFAMPSTGEGFGIVFLEAAASGLPVIAGDADGSADALADGAIGTLIDPASQDELVRASVAALQGLLPNDPAAVQRFAFANFARHVNDLVEHLIAA